MKTVSTTRAARAVVGAALGVALMASPGHALTSTSASADAQVSAVAAEAKVGPSGHRRTPVAKRHRKGVVRVLRVTDSRPVVGDEITLTGRTHRAKRTVVLYSRTVAAKSGDSRRGAKKVRPGRWQKVATTRATSRGTFRFERTVADATPRQYRVRTHLKARGKAGRKARLSGTVSVRPRPAAAPVRPAARPGKPVQKPVGTPRPRPVTPAPSPGASSAPATGDRAAQVAAELDRLVRELRASRGRHSADHNACLKTWADGFAADMSRNNLFAHSSSSEWEGGALSVVDACADQAPAVVRQEAIARVAGDEPAAVAAQALAEMLEYWAHEEVLLEDFGTTRAMEVGVAPHPVHGWYVVVALAAA